MISGENERLELFGQLPLPALWVECQSWQIERLTASAETLLKLSSDSPPSEDQALATRALPNWLKGELTKFTGLTGLEYAFEKEVITAHGSRWFNIIIKGLRDYSGHASTMLVVLVDISAQKGFEKLVRQMRRELEEQVEERTAELARSNASLLHYIDECKRSAIALKKLSSAVEQTADHVIITNKLGIIEYVNPAFERMSGFSNQEVLGKTPRIVKSGKHTPEFFQKLWQTILAGKVFRAEFINRKKNGELYREEKTITPIKDDHGRINHFVSVGRALKAIGEEEFG